MDNTNRLGVGGHSSATPSLALPPELQQLLGLDVAGQSASSSYAYGYAQGGLVTPAGAAPPGQVGVTPTPGMAPPPQSMEGAGAPPAGGVSEEDINSFIQQHPQQVQQIAAQLQQLVQSGEVTLQQLTMAEQLAMVALQNPQMYPKMRQFAISQGLVEEQDISPGYDQGLLFLVILGVRAVKGSGAQAAPTQDAMNFADGGLVTTGDNAQKGGYTAGPGTTTSDSIPIQVSTGEYVIPAHVVHMKGKEFFDSLLEKYKPDEKTSD